MFGEIALVGEGLRTADVFADTEVRVIAMFGTRFRELQMLAPEVAERLDAIARDRASAQHGQTAAG